MAKLYSLLSPASPGKTSFLLNTAKLYAKTFPEQRVLVVDFDFLKPDLAAFLDLSSSQSVIRTVADLHVLLSGYQTLILDDFFTIPFPDVSNLRILPGDLNNIHRFHDIPEEQWFEFFKQLRNSSDMVLFDTGREFDNPAVRYLISESDLLFVLTQADPLTLFHTRTLLNNLISQGRSNDIRLLLLRYRQKSAYTLDYISHLLPEPIYYLIPDVSNKDYQAQFLNATLLANDTKHPYSIALQGLLNTLLDIPHNQQKRGFKWQLPLLTKHSSVK